MKKEVLLKYREFHWNYFSLHAEQRLKTFHFYLIVSAILIGAFINIFNGEQDLKLAFILPYVLTFISFIFYMIDVRARYMLKTSQDAIKLIDTKIIKNDEEHPSRLNIFEFDEYLVKDKKGGMNYSKSFGLIFIIFGFLSFAAGSYYLYSWIATMF